MEKYSGIFGLRLGRGLHLGHLIGNIYPAFSDCQDKTINIILADLFTLSSNRKEDISVNNVLNLYAECYLLGLNTPNTHYIIQSEIAKELQPLINLIGCFIPYKKTTSIQPIKSYLKENRKVMLNQFSFPVVQASEMIGLNSDRLYSNIDNLGVVSLTKEIVRILNHKLALNLVDPDLKHGIFPSVKGTDYKKMSNSANNCLYLTDSYGTVTEKIIKIDTATKTNREVPNFDLLYCYLQILGYTSIEIEELKDSYSLRKLGARDIKNLVINRFWEKFQLFKVQRDMFINENRKFIVEKIRSDTHYVKKNVIKNVEQIIDIFYDKNFTDLFRKNV